MTEDEGTVEVGVEHGDFKQVLRCVLHSWSWPCALQGGERGGVGCRVVSGGGVCEGCTLSHSTEGGAGERAPWCPL